MTKLFCAPTDEQGADPRRLGYVGAPPGARSARDGDAWFTPARYLSAAREVLGSIDLDPYSSAAANLRVGATWTFTSERPAPRGEEWPTCEAVWMNPPYSSRGVSEATERFIAAFQAGRFERGIVLVNNATETRFFQSLLREATAVCLPNHRIAFECVDGKRVSNNPRGQALFYFGPAPDLFRRIFGEFGTVLRCCWELELSEKGEAR